MVGVAIRALGCADRGLPSAELAELARSAYVDPRLLAPSGERRELSRVARAFDETPRAVASTALGSLLGTVRAWHAAKRERTEQAGRTAGAAERAELAGDEEVTSRLARALLSGERARTRVEHVAATRALFAALGFDRRVRGAIVRRFVDEARDDGVVERAELAARARDARGWERLVAGVDGYEAALARLGIAHLPATSETFRHELAQVITELGQRRGRGARRHPARADVARGGRRAARSPRGGRRGGGRAPGGDAGRSVLSGGAGEGSRQGTAAFGPRRRSVRRAVELGAFAVADGAGAAHDARLPRGRRQRSRARARSGLRLARARAAAGRALGQLAHRAEPALRPRDCPRSSSTAPTPAARARFRPELARRARVEDEREGFFLDPARTRSAGVGDLTAVVAAEAQLSCRRALRRDGRHPRARRLRSRALGASCRFMGFASTVLRVRERPRVREYLEPREAGTLIHEALAAAFRATAPAWAERPRDRPGLFARAMGVADEVLARQTTSGLREIALARARASIAQVIEASIDDERWDFALAEQSFGESAPGSWPPLVFRDLRDANGAPVILRGRLDRMDRAHRTTSGEPPARVLRVVDYKSSAGSQATTALGDTALQLPVYALAALAAQAAPAATATLATARARADAAYLGYSTRERGGTSDKRDQALSDRLDELLDPTSGSGGDGARPIVRRVLDLVGEGRAGDLVPTKATAPCARCVLDGICRKPRFTVPAVEGEESARE